mmetsp:Transcript_31808/g.31517  ORF Transcript_31808/g.31517 Transcript_31808/m.31517 type:complete len:211 (+) Transcript_31808:512-1144(+)
MHSGHNRVTLDHIVSGEHLENSSGSFLGILLVSGAFHDLSNRGFHQVRKDQLDGRIRQKLDGENPKFFAVEFRCIALSVRCWRLRLGFLRLRGGFGLHRLGFHGLRGFHRSRSLRRRRLLDMNHSRFVHTHECVATSKRQDQFQSLAIRHSQRFLQLQRRRHVDHISIFILVTNREASLPINGIQSLFQLIVRRLGQVKPVNISIKNGFN